MPIATKQYLSVIPLFFFPFHVGLAQDLVTEGKLDRILTELASIRTLLEGNGPRAATARTEQLTIDTGSAPSIGASDAPLAVVEFTDYECGFCQRFHLAIFPELKKRYIDSGKIRFISMDMPLPFHANAHRAALGVRCAGLAGKYWEMRDVVQSNPSKLESNYLQEYATQLGISPTEFRSCLDSGQFDSGVRDDIARASQIGVNGTPSFIIGKKTSGGIVKGKLVIGAPSIEAFEEEFRRLNAEGTRLPGSK